MTFPHAFGGLRRGVRRPSLIAYMHGLSIRDLHDARRQAHASVAGGGKYFSIRIVRLDLQTYREGPIDGLSQLSFAYKSISSNRFRPRICEAGCECRCYSIGIMPLRSGRVRKINQKLERAWVRLLVRGNSWRLITMAAIGVPGRGSSGLLRLAAMVLGAIRIRSRALAFSAKRG